MEWTKKVPTRVERMVVFYIRIVFSKLPLLFIGCCGAKKNEQHFFWFLTHLLTQICILIVVFSGSWHTYLEEEVKEQSGLLLPHIHIQLPLHHKCIALWLWIQDEYGGTSSSRCFLGQDTDVGGVVKKNSSKMWRASVMEDLREIMLVLVRVDTTNRFLEAFDVMIYTVKFCLCWNKLFFFSQVQNFKFWFFATKQYYTHAPFCNDAPPSKFNVRQPNKHVRYIRTHFWCKRRNCVHTTYL